MRAPKSFSDIPSLETAGWTLVSAEARNLAAPDTFEIPALQEREALRAGDAALLLFDIQTKADGKTIDLGVDRMWVIVRQAGDTYQGVLDNDPGVAESLDLQRGDSIPFRASHICAIGTPPREYVVATYGADFFD
jgi:hypothetical protein